MKARRGRPVTAQKFSGLTGAGTPIEVGHAFWILMQRPGMTYEKAMVAVRFVNKLSKNTIDKYRKQYRLEVLEPAARKGITPRQQFARLQRNRDSAN